MRPALKSLSLLLLGTSLLGSTARAQLVEVPTPNLGAACDDLDAGSILTAIDRELPSLSRRPTTELTTGQTNLGRICRHCSNSLPSSSIRKTANRKRISV